ncbi:MAG: 1-(5-phosphoribosyl)-5-((5-phosphoribosylamino)methylideneamino)imidazole-4-carboxamide isomerase, partial [Clostridiaceae bacterium]|nr:1-(5-phosphoribosyl)-5-((5-phosphoribosylamino)methylideneamino)imidazole-4-carboxamide isomerase [Clostridiaceae bacterium]
MIIFPAIDIKDGKCVRLLRGDFNEVTVYSENPHEVAKRWEAEGGEFLHIVDLDGAREGFRKNSQVILKILESVKIPIQVGGGIRDMETVDFYLNSG